MRWEDRGRSRNLEDRRGRRAPSAGVPLGLGGVLVLFVLSLLLGTDLFSLLGLTPQSSGPTAPPTPGESAEEENLVRFVSFVLDDSQERWSAAFAEGGLEYRDATLVIYRDAVESACGVAPSSVGPFYCPPDESIYVDLSFYRELRERYGASGDFAQAYVLAHEVAHHVQNLLGTAEQVRELQQQRPEMANRLSVAMELQADCFAGVWAATASERELLEAGDLEEAMAAAAAVGDDRLQSRRGSVNPDSFTHGSAEQRQSWFRTGYQSGDPASCDTFSALP